MGDRCTVVITYRRSDADRFDATWLGAPQDTDANGGHTETGYWYDMNYAAGIGCDAGGFGYLPQDIPLCGYHDAGDDYDGQCFATPGDGVLAVCDGDRHGHPIVRIGQDGEPNEHELQRARAYLAISQRVNELLAGHGPKGQHDGQSDARSTRSSHDPHTQH